MAVLGLHRYKDQKRRCLDAPLVKDFNYERYNHILTPEIESIMLANKVLRKNKNKKEVKNDLLSMMAPPVLQSCSTISSFNGPFALENTQLTLLNIT